MFARSDGNSIMQHIKSQDDVPKTQDTIIRHNIILLFVFDFFGNHNHKQNIEKQGRVGGSGVRGDERRDSVANSDDRIWGKVICTFAIQRQGSNVVQTRCVELEVGVTGIVNRNWTKIVV